MSRGEGREASGWGVAGVSGYYYGAENKESGNSIPIVRRRDGQTVARGATMSDDEINRRTETRREEVSESRLGMDNRWCWVSQPLYTDRLRKTLGGNGQESKHPSTANGEWRTGSCPLDKKKVICHWRRALRRHHGQPGPGGGGPNRTMARGVPSRSSGTLLIGAVVFPANRKSRRSKLAAGGPGIADDRGGPPSLPGTPPEKHLLQFELAIGSADHSPFHPTTLPSCSAIP